jgi:hypothetical protein
MISNLVKEKELNPEKKYLRNPFKRSIKYIFDIQIKNRNIKKK